MWKWAVGVENLGMLQTQETDIRQQFTAFTQQYTSMDPTKLKRLSTWDDLERELGMFVGLQKYIHKLQSTADSLVARRQAVLLDTNKKMAAKATVKTMAK